MKFKKAYKKYLEYVSLKQKPTSILNLKRKFSTHILPFFENKNIKRINTKDYLNWQLYINNKNLKYCTKKNLHYLMTGFYDYLQLFHSIKKDIPEMVGNFKKDLHLEENKHQVWTIEEYNKFISVVDNQIYHALFNFLFFTGCRKGEALALQFQDFTNDEIFINKSISKDLINGKRFISTPKTEKSIRKIRIDNYLIEELNNLRIHYKSLYGAFNEKLYIFGGKEPLSCTTLGRYKNYYCDKANVKRIRIHDFRHSHASILFENHINTNTISKRLGHASTKTTLDTYIHDFDENEKRALELLLSLHKI